MRVRARGDLIITSEQRVAKADGTTAALRIKFRAMCEGTEQCTSRLLEYLTLQRGEMENLFIGDVIISLLMLRVDSARNFVTNLGVNTVVRLSHYVYPICSGWIYIYNNCLCVCVCVYMCVCICVHMRICM